MYGYFTHGTDPPFRPYSLPSSLFPTAFAGCLPRPTSVAGCPRSPLEEHAFGLGQGQDRIQRVFHRVDEAGAALRARVSGNAEVNLIGGEVIVPVGGVGFRLDALASDVKPHVRIEGH